MLVSAPLRTCNPAPRVSPPLRSHSIRASVSLVRGALAICGTKNDYQSGQSSSNVFFSFCLLLMQARTQLIICGVLPLTRRADRYCLRKEEERQSEKRLSGPWQGTLPLRSCALDLAQSHLARLAARGGEGPARREGVGYFAITQALSPRLTESHAMLMCVCTASPNLDVTNHPTSGGSQFQRFRSPRQTPEHALACRSVRQTASELVEVLSSGHAQRWHCWPCVTGPLDWASLWRAGLCAAFSFLPQAVDPILHDAPPARIASLGASQIGPGARSRRPIVASARGRTGQGREGGLHVCPLLAGEV